MDVPTSNHIASQFDTIIYMVPLFSYILFFTVFYLNLWFQKLNKWTYLIPVVLILLLVCFVGLLNNNLLFALKYWLIAFVGGWIAAYVVNFFAGLIKK